MSHDGSSRHRQRDQPIHQRGRGTCQFLYLLREFLLILGYIPQLLILRVSRYILKYIPRYYMVDIDIERVPRYILKYIPRYYMVDIDIERVTVDIDIERVCILSIPIKK